MSQGPDLQEPVFADAGGVHVEKSYVPDEFPVPAIRFRIEAPADEAVSVRLTDEIPESFPMDRIGFHPEFESENWTAYQNHRVEFNRDLAADETVTTVYGVRTDDEEELAAFIVAPALERTDAAGAASSEVAEVIGEDTSDAVREVVANEDTSLAGLDEAKADREAAESDIEAAVSAAESATDAPEADEAGDADTDEAGGVDEAPLEADAAADPSQEPADDGADDDGDDEPVPELNLADPNEEAEPPGGEDATANAVPTGDAEETEEAEPTEDAERSENDADEPSTEPDVDPLADDAEAVTAEATPTDATATPAAAAGDDGGLAARLAAEIRAGEVADDDLAVLREELDLGLPRSVDARIRSLQSEMADLSAYTDALEQFIDEEGSAQEVVESFDRELEGVSSNVDRLSERVDDAETERAELDAELHGLTDEVEAAEGRLDETEGDVAATESRVVDLSTELDDVAATVASTEADVSSLTEWVEDHESDIDSLNGEVAAVETEVERVADRVDELSTRVDGVEADQQDAADISAAVADVESDLDDVREELDGVQQFRERINRAFGPGAGTGDE